MPSDLNPSKRTVLDITTDLADGRTSSRELIEAALARIADPAGEGAPRRLMPARRHII
jgi:hypothetical protein